MRLKPSKNRFFLALMSFFTVAIFAAVFSASHVIISEYETEMYTTFVLLKEEGIENRKIIARDRVHSIVQYLEAEQKKIDTTIQEKIKNSVDTAYTLLNAYYERNIKEIYGKIITFAISAQGKFSQENMYDLVAIKNANICIVEAFKASKHMQKNMLKYLESSNSDIKNEYNHIRKNLISHLRTMQLIFNTEEEDVAILLLSKLHVDTQKYDIAANKSLDNLIRTNKINYTMATSLMNDTTYAYTIASELSKAAQLLFVHEKKELKEGREALILTETEASALAHETP